MKGMLETERCRLRVRGFGNEKRWYCSFCQSKVVEFVPSGFCLYQVPGTVLVRLLVPVARDVMKKPQSPVRQREQNVVVIATKHSTMREEKCQRIAHGVP